MKKRIYTTPQVHLYEVHPAEVLLQSITGSTIGGDSNIPPIPSTGQTSETASGSPQEDDDFKLFPRLWELAE